LSGEVDGKQAGQTRLVDRARHDAAAFALNEGGGGRTDGHGKVLVQSMQVGEKAAQNYRLETTNPGGHSSIPIRDNAIYELADALAKVRDYEFRHHARVFRQGRGCAWRRPGARDGDALAKSKRRGG
jgi:hypothetical protein